MTISVDCRVGAKVTPRNDRKNITFTGLKEDIAVSLEIVENFSQKYGRLHSNTFMATKILQLRHLSSNPIYANILNTLDILKEKYKTQINDTRKVLYGWRYKQIQKKDGSLNLTGYIEKTKELLLSKKLGNCGENAIIIQNEHLQKGIVTHNIQIRIFCKTTGSYLRGHVFSLARLPVTAELGKPKTWGRAILIDSWCGAGSKRGIVEQARATGLKENGLTKVLKFLRYDPKEEIVMFDKADDELAEEFIAKMKAQKSKICTENSQAVFYM